MIVGVQLTVNITLQKLMKLVNSEVELRPQDSSQLCSVPAEPGSEVTAFQD